MVYCSKYEGDWKDDKRTGYGTYTWPDGDKYVGEYKDDERCGRGTYIYHYDERRRSLGKDESDSVILH